MAVSDGLVALWQMENNWQDSVGAYHGTPYGAVFNSAGPLVGAYSGSFDGIDDKVAIAGVPPNPASLTLACWIKLPSIAAVHKYLYMGSAADLGFYINANNKVAMGKIQTNEVASNAAINNTERHHLAVTSIIGASVSFYIDGIFDSTKAYTPTYTIGGKCLAMRPDASGYGSFNGLMDQLGLWNRQLSADEIAELAAITPEKGNRSRQMRSTFFR